MGSKKEEKNPLKCPNCGADHTRSGSVGRDYMLYGYYDRNGNFEPSGNVEHLDNPDRCVACGQDIQSDEPKSA